MRHGDIIAHVTPHLSRTHLSQPLKFALLLACGSVGDVSVYNLGTDAFALPIKAHQVICYTRNIHVRQNQN